MADPFLSVQAPLSQMAKLKTRLANFPASAINAGMDAVADFLNDDNFRESMYPPESDEPFLWSSDKQRRAYFATNGFGKGIPYSRTHELMLAGQFKIHKSRASLWITYENLAPYAKWVIGNGTQIIGHIARGWKPANTFVVDKAVAIHAVFDKGTIGSWEKTEAFMFGGGGGL